MAADLYQIDVISCANSLVEQAASNCPVCHGRMALPRYAIGSGQFHIVDCQECGTGRLAPMPTPEDLSRFYPEEYYGSSGKKFRGIIEKLIQLVLNRLSWFISRRVPAQGRILDVGCGRGVLLNRLADLGYETYGTDITQEAVRGNDERSDIRVVPDLHQAEFPDQFFDGVVVWHVLEHLISPTSTLQEIERITKPGGIIIVAVPNYSSIQAKLFAADWFHLDPPRHIFHFPLSALVKLIESAGFQSIKSYHFSLRQNPFGWVQSGLNRWTKAPRNTLYSLLHRHFADRSKTTPWQRYVQFTAYYLGMPVGFLLSIACALIKRGATVHVVARKPQ